MIKITYFYLHLNEKHDEPLVPKPPLDHSFRALHCPFISALKITILASILLSYLKWTIRGFAQGCMVTGEAEMRVLGPFHKSHPWGFRVSSHNTNSASRLSELSSRPLNPRDQSNSTRQVGYINHQVTH